MQSVKYHLKTTGLRFGMFPSHHLLSRRIEGHINHPVHGCQQYYNMEYNGGQVNIKQSYLCNNELCVKGGTEPGGQSPWLAKITILLRKYFAILSNFCRQMLNSCYNWVKTVLDCRRSISFSLCKSCEKTALTLFFMPF